MKLTTFELSIKSKKYKIVVNEDEIISSAPYHLRSYIERPLSVLCYAFLKNHGCVGLKRILRKEVE